MVDEKNPAPSTEAPKISEAPAKPKKLTDEEKYGGSGGKFGGDVKSGRGGPGGRGRGKGGKGFIDPGHP